jgi:general secretion pathway protein E
MLERELVTGDGVLDAARRGGAEPVLGDADLGGPDPQAVRIATGRAADIDAEPLAAETPPTATAAPVLDEAEPELNGEGLAPEAQDSVQARVVAYLEAHDKLTHAEYGRARRLAEDGGDPILRMLVRLGLVSGRDLALALAEVMDLPLADPSAFPLAPVAEGRFSLRFLKDNHVLPLREDGDALEVAMADPTETFVVEALAMAAGKSVKTKVGLASEIDTALERLYEQPEQKPAEQEGEVGEFDEEDIEHLKDLASEAPVIRMVNQIVQRAVDARASDIHIEPFADELKVRYRVDGILQEVESPPVRSTAAIISRVKIMAKLNIAERRLPQDGRIPLRVQGKDLDLRVSTVPTMFGESVVMRLLDKESVRFDLDALGFDGSPKDRLLSVLDVPYGILLVTGPTGSGKSTTLYTALSRLNTQERKIITVEDPVEYQLPGINQIQVKAQIGMTFAGALRAIVRQDPDIIMVGEMRDLETARIAVQSALTGHVVLSTLHTNDAASGVTRLLDMGVEDYLLTSTVNGILAQRLVRRLCPHCRQPYTPLPELTAKLSRVAGRRGTAEPITLYRAVGCDECNGTGYRGRLVITEALLMSDGIRQAVLRHATASEIQRIAIEEGMITMYDDGLRKAMEGRTTVEDVMRVAEEA